MVSLLGGFYAIKYVSTMPASDLTSSPAIDRNHDSAVSREWHGGWLLAFIKIS